MNLAPNLMALPFVANVLVIEESCVNLDENAVLQEITFYDDDMVFVDGMERLGIWLIHKGQKYHLRVVIFEEGANIITEIEDMVLKRRST